MWRKNAEMGKLLLEVKPVPGLSVVGQMVYWSVGLL